MRHMLITNIVLAYFRGIRKPRAHYKKKPCKVKHMCFCGWWLSALLNKIYARHSAAMWNCWHTSVMHVIFLHTRQTCLWGIFWKKWCEWREEGGNESERETRRPFETMSAISLQWEGWLLITVCNMISRLLVPAWRVSQFVFRCQWGCGRVGHWSRVSTTTHRAS